MSKPSKFFPKSDKTISANSLVAAFVVAVMLSVVVVSQHKAISNSGEKNISERIALKKEMSRARRHSLFANPYQVKQSILKPKTERARDFNKTIKSENYWNELHAKIAKPKQYQLPKKKPKFPPVVIGSKD